MIPINLSSFTGNILSPKYDPAYPLGNRDGSFTLLKQDNFSTGIDSVFYTNEAGSVFTSASLDVVGGNSSQKVKFSFIGNANDTVDAQAQLAFTLDQLYREIVIDFDLYIPTNYSHVVPSDNANNNKFFRLWQNTYGDTTSGQHFGASTFANNGDSSLSTEIQHFGSGVGPGVGDNDIAYGNFITAADHGNWISIRIHVRAGTVGGNYQFSDVNGTFWRGDGFVRIYKNNILTANNPTMPAIGTGPQGWRYGYILGAANSGFRQDTFPYLDNLTINGIV